MKMIIASALCSLFLQSPSRAQDPVLLVEKAKDSLARSRALAKLRTVRIDIKLDSAGPKVLAKQLNLLVGKSVTFFVRAHDGETGYAALDLDLKRARVSNVMAIVSRVSDVRFVYFAGVVMITHKDDVKEVSTLRLYDVRAATAKLTNFVGPRIGLRNSDGDQEVVSGEEVEGGTVSGLTSDKIEELIRAQVLPQSWGGDNGASISSSNAILFIRQSARGHAAVRKLLYQLGVGPGPAPRSLLNRARRAHAKRRAARVLPSKKGKKGKKAR